MLSVRISSYGCTREVSRARKIRKSLSFHCLMFICFVSFPNSLNYRCQKMQGAYKMCTVNYKPFNPWKWLASNFSFQYHPWIKHWGHNENKGNDGQLKNLLIIKTLPTRVVRKLMIPTWEPIPTYTSLNPVSLLHGVYVYISLTNYFVIMFTSCRKWLGWNVLNKKNCQQIFKWNFLHINKTYCCVSC